jgi:O-antigen/teichoic acid export membrane protein
MQYNRFTFLETGTSLVGSLAFIVLAYFIRSVWALVVGNLVSSTLTTVASFFIVPNVQLAFLVSRRFAIEIASYGKWIFASSAIYFLATNLDRLYLAKLLPLSLLGIYGIARFICRSFRPVSSAAR